MTRTERQFDQRRESQAQKIRSRFRSRGRLTCAPVSRVAGREQGSRQPTLLDCEEVIEEIRRSSESSPYSAPNRFTFTCTRPPKERSQGAGSVNRRWPRKRRKPQFLARMEFTGGTTLRGGEGRSARPTKPTRDNILQTETGDTQNRDVYYIVVQGIGANFVQDTHQSKFHERRSRIAGPTTSE